MSTKPARFALAIAAVTALLVACSDSEESTSEPTPTFSIALSIEGRGKVTGDQTRIDCLGPGSCGAIAIFAPAVKLEASPVAGYRFDGWSLGGAASSGPSLDVSANANAPVIARFAPDGAGGGQDGGGGSADGGPSTNPDNNCLTLQCDNNTMCCIEGTLTAPSSKPPSCEFPTNCARDRVVCLKDADCAGNGAFDTCCAGFGGVSCMPATSCTGAPYGRLCDDARPCPSGQTCTVVNSAANLRACAAPGGK
jgi:hypothetical protein